MVENLKEQCSLYIMPFLLCLLYIFEAFYKIIFFLDGKTTQILQISKGIIFVCLLVYILRQRPQKLLLTAILFILFIIGQSALGNPMIKPVFFTYIKYVYIIVLLLFFSIVELSNKQKNLLFKIFEAIIVFNSILILIGFIMNIKIFSTYLGPRFGYNGLFITSATGSYVYCLSLIYLLVKYKRIVFYKYTNVIIIFSTLFIGTKTVYLLLSFFLIVYVWEYSNINKKTLIFFVFGLCLLGAYIFFFKYGVFKEIREEDGLISSIMTYRNDLLLERTIPYVKDNWGVLNYLFGGVSDLSTKSQIEFFDIFYFFGILGGGVYYYIFLKEFLVFKINNIIIVMLVSMFIIVLLAGNFFGYTSIAIYVVILREYLKFI